MHCPICLSSDTVPCWHIYDDRYGFQGTFILYYCRSCGHKAIEGEFSKELLRKLYSDFYPRSAFKLEDFQPSNEVKGFMSWLNGENRSAYGWVPKNVRVLDIGCGLGETLAYHKARGCDVYGVEADENIKRVAEKFDFNIHIGLFDPDVYDPDYFDYVTMDQVIEHVNDPITTMKGIAKVLKPDGFAIFSTPNMNGWGARVFGKTWINWHAPYHIHHYSVESMKIAACRAGLIVETHKTVTSSEWLYYQWLHLFAYPQEGKPSAFWSYKTKRSYKEMLLFGLITLIHFTKINHIITRVFDALGMGDNSLFILRKK